MRPLLVIKNTLTPKVLDSTARLAVTGDSAGGHLSASMATMIERVGDGGWGVKPGVYEYLPTYMPKGMTAKEAQKNLLAIKAAGHKAELVIVEDASHAFFDWKPDQRTKDTFAKYGVPYAADMMRFFDEVFYK